MAHEDCLFCKIAKGEIPGDIVYETDEIIAFNDINPQAPVHVLIIPKRHMDNVLEFDSNDGKLLVEITKAVNHIVEQNNLKENGFRVVTNTGSDGGQAVFHLHFHLLGGRAFSWPPG